MKLASIETIARALNEASVPFIVVGGLAVAAHGYARQTIDLDIVTPLDPATLRTLFAVLETQGYRTRVPVTVEGFSDPDQRARWIREKGLAVLGFHSDRHRETPIDVFATIPFDFDEEYRLAMVEDVAPGVPVRIVRLESLLRLKEHAGRPQDLADIAELRSIHEKRKDD